MQGRSDSFITGIDVSNYQPNVDWTQVSASGIAFAYIKATEGMRTQDAMFPTHAANARAAGIPVGAYHFAHPESNTPQDEANNFLAALNSVTTDLAPVLDLESPPQQNSALTGDFIANWARTFINLVAEATGKRVFLYTGKWYTDMYGVTGLSDISLWISYYSTSAPPDFAGWTEWTMWQYTESGTVNGISGNVDMNLAVSLDALRGIATPVYATKKVQINGKPWMDGIVVNDETYVVWTALQAFNTPYTYKGNGVMTIDGADVQGVVYNGDTYLLWTTLAKNVQSIAIDGGWNFVYCPTKKVQLNGKPWMDGIVINDETYVIWTALQEFKTPFTYKGNGLMTIDGVDVQGVVYNGDTYLLWNTLARDVQAQPITDGWNFVVS
ncbi:N-acetylmuramoyl-L-alanine amidase [Heliobacterium gestii]|uniref:N-acetylmuramoyl-L-alanine amidase n=1 Tax=Heliomicrobium gestii TaxID=2699 RepID=A0A845L6I5_HELGE|nr:glycoside hydrolase family 25 protein [Heliomicrobium gestii]MBM7865578.1 GH25 family lysozyme M1 (1,4-beta-N-acetylmuramidase) [Heliomicrobium gestii]MZP41828.1 N-acetylmuramoyl-L-alanine amidase [Heliomicrobium gestii]